MSIVAMVAHLSYCCALVETVAQKLHRHPLTGQSLLGEGVARSVGVHLAQGVQIIPGVALCA